MSIRPSAILVVVATLFSGSALRAEPLTKDQLQNARAYLAGAMGLLQMDSDKEIDVTLDSLAGAYQGSKYQGRRDADGFRNDLVETGAALKRDIARLQSDVEQAGGGKNAASIIVLLSKQQVVNLKLYRWLYRVTEVCDLALALSKKSDPDSGQFLTKMIQTHEKRQDATEDVIQAIAARTCDQ